MSYPVLPFYVADMTVVFINQLLSVRFVIYRKYFIDKYLIHSDYVHAQNKVEAKGYR